jgi:hypothetical protein
MNMKKGSIIAATIGLLFYTACPAIAQNDDSNVKKISFVAKVGATYPLDGMDETSNKIGPQLGLEALWNLRHLPIDIGAELYLGCAVRNHDTMDDLSNRTISLLTVSDYNFSRGSKFSPFIGVGIGVGRCEVVIGDKEKHTRFCVAPRFGFLAFHHLRFTLDAHITKITYSHVGASVGYSF